MAENKKTVQLPHNIIMENRRKLNLTGVSDIDSFDEETVIVFTEQGELTIRGSNLHINKIDVEAGELDLEGAINSLSYTDNRPHKGGMLSRFFG